MTDKTKQEVQRLTATLQTGLEDILNSDNFKDYLCTMSKFHNYSYSNVILIRMQCPDASFVAGYSAWKTKFNRSVKKGERAIKILAPFTCSVSREVIVLDDNGNSKFGKDGKEFTRIEKVKTVYFRPVSVFDISQTIGEPLHNFEIKELTDSMDDYYTMREALIRSAPVPVKFKYFDDSAKGYYSKSDNMIVIRNNMSQSQTIKTLIHEIAHSLMHSEESGMPRFIKEIEAESVACIVSNYFGLDTSDYSFKYIAEWNGSSDMKQFKKSLDKIQKTASAIIDSVLARKNDISSKIQNAEN